MADYDDLLKAIGIPVRDEPETGRFFQGLGGYWRHACSADFPFQADFDMIFDCDVKTEYCPESMPHNVTWIQDHLTEIWNAAALAINNMVEAQEIEMHDEFALEHIFFELPDNSVENAFWHMLIEPSYLNASFEITFKGLSVIDQKYKA